MEKLSIIIPVYNEEKTISTLLDKVNSVKLNINKEIIIVNDGSFDNTLKIIENWINKKKININLINKKNEGKGSAVKLGIKNSTGDIIIIQDADLEYDPNDYQKLINPILKKKVKVVYGSRNLDKSNKLYSGLSFYLGGRIVTLATNILYLSRLTDEPTCYKVFDSKLIKSIDFKGKGFEWEPEITARILKKRIKIKEIPIKYFPRKVKEGKKINWKDGLIAFWTLFKWRFNE
jgi:glycosyltransferase involved in cell wall biosynthesis